MTIPSAAEFFAAKLTYETDPADLAAARAAGTAPLLLDVRSAAAWRQGRIPGAVHLPGDRLADGITAVAPDPATAIVVYCWGPGCNGSTRAALALTRLGYSAVRELIGGYEYWVREGLAVVDDRGRSRRPVDPLVGPVPGATVVT
ncbi:rhodanese-like domain-containing protein [Kineococcus gynurae]|uniref:Rhodanese-like domain-containing protein n=1 Tax=Kineococcus gynurae TaxID=452979 RepID=A0ABV5LNJ6_9ACTN